MKFVTIKESFRHLGGNFLFFMKKWFGFKCTKVRLKNECILHTYSFFLKNDNFLVKLSKRYMEKFLHISR